MANGSTPNWDQLINQLVNQIGSPLAIETPQLGRLENHRPQDLLSAVYLLTMLQNQSAGIANTGVFTAVYDRGLSCPNGG